MKIRILDSHLVNQIAAGEVIERPGSVVKELLENSLDAGATEITIEVEAGGTKLISLRDNGCGIARNDMVLAIKRHATSKIASIDDLEQVRSLGFRGEALASIASIAKFKLSSHSAADDMGWQLISQGDSKDYILEPTAHPLGTTVEIGDLFFNMPVRRKFLRREQTEFNHILEIIGKIALSRFDVEIILKHNGKKILSLGSVKNTRESLERIGMIVGQEFVQNSYALNIANDEIKLTGWISTPSYTRSQADLQYTYVNHRIVRDKIITHALRQAYQDLIFTQRHPVAVLYLTIDPRMVDVNVHPTKAEVRFADGRMIHDFLLRGLRESLAQGKVRQVAAMVADENGSCNFGPSSSLQSDTSSLVVKRRIAEEVNMCNLQEATVPAGDASMLGKARSRGGVRSPKQSINVAKDMDAYEKLVSFAKDTCITSSMKNDYPRDAMAEVNKEIAMPSLGFALAQLGGRYILAENSEGLIIVDMHAAHERINYEKLKEQYDRANIPAQTLLIPHVLNLSNREIDALEENQMLVQKIGFTLERSSPDTVLLRAVPVLLQHGDVVQLAKDFIADLLSQVSLDSVEDKINHILATISCHGSIRSGQELNLDTMNELLRKIEDTNFGDRCSHGRPTWRTLTFAEIDKFFLRT